MYLGLVEGFVYDGCFVGCVFVFYVGGLWYVVVFGIGYDLFVGVGVLWVLCGCGWLD